MYHITVGDTKTDLPFPTVYCCSKSVMLICTIPRFSIIKLSQCVTLPLPGPPVYEKNFGQKAKRDVPIATSCLPSTKITGTFGVSNFTWPFVYANIPVSFLFVSSISSASQFCLSLEPFLKCSSSGILSVMKIFIK